jgi:hypothetical protein
MNSMFKYPKAENLGTWMFIFYFDFNADAALGAEESCADAHCDPTLPPPQWYLSQEAAGHRLPGHLLVKVLLDVVVMLDEGQQLLIGPPAARQTFSSRVNILPGL